jgi:hypothetical protein
MLGMYEVLRSILRMKEREWGERERKEGKKKGGK